MERQAQKGRRTVGPYTSTPIVSGVRMKHADLAAADEETGVSGFLQRDTSDRALGSLDGHESVAGVYWLCHASGGQDHE